MTNYWKYVKPDPRDLDKNPYIHPDKARSGASPRATNADAAQEEQSTPSKRGNMKTKLTISVACILLAIAHNIWPSIKADLATMALVVVAILPWLAGVIRSIELPGGFKIELNDVKAATEKVAAGRVAKATSSSLATDRVDLALLSEVGERDPNLALVGLRIEIERRLTRLASAIGIGSNRRSAGLLLRDLVSRDAVDPETAAGLADLIALGNQAAHGADVSRSAASWAMESGPLVLGVLDTLIAGSAVHAG